MSLQFLAPNLAVHIASYGYSAEVVGVSYGIPGILFAITCPFVHKLTQRVERRGVILVGWMMIILAMLMLGGTNWIPGFYNNSDLIFVGLMIIGLSAGMVSIPILPEMLEAVEED